MAIMKTTSCEKWGKNPISLVQRKELMNSSRRKKTLKYLDKMAGWFFNQTWGTGARDRGLNIAKLSSLCLFTGHRNRKYF